ncbi:Aft2p PWA37_002200 [Arxiozyma heterogenica]|uniref:Uncharacterized protein n=1 Tax=Arxiozyma heterogenica TaxID=278026 RepID=A0AAN8A844_9SACH|nr:hypothetical protein RI543_003584 [Kazachstania heterogenica]
MVRQPRSIWSPNNLSNALIREQNKLIHLDPVPLFKDRNEIKFWLQKSFFPQGINLVIERSDNSKIIFKCKSSITKRQQQEKTKTERSGSSSKSFCPFRIRATYSIKLKKWNILIVNNVHSHELKFDPSTDEYRKFKNYLYLQKDKDTMKFFEELEYKTKFNLPMSSPSTQIVTCDCGLTNEINWFNNIIIPEPSILNKSDINRNNSKSKNNFVSKKKLISSKNTLANDSLSILFNNNNNDNNNSNNITNTTLTTNITNTKNDMINLDEIDFTDMFKPFKKKVQNLKYQTAKSSSPPPSSSSTFSSALSSSLFSTANIINTYPYTFDTNQNTTIYNLDDEMFSLFDSTNTYTKSMATTIIPSITDVQNKHDEQNMIQDDNSWLDRYLDFNQESSLSTLSPSSLFQKNDIIPKNNSITSTITTTSPALSNAITDDLYLDFLDLSKLYPPV